MTAAQRITRHPDEALVFHRVNVVIAEVTKAAAARAEQRSKRHRAIAAELGRLAPEVSELLEAAPPVSTLSGPKAARELRALHDLLRDHDWVARVILPFLCEHDALLDEGVRLAIERFFEWLPQRADELRERVQFFEQQVAADLERDQGDLKKLADAWSEVDGDGL